MKILYLCPDGGVPVQGHKGAAVHVRSLIAAFGRAGHDVVLAAQVLNKSPWEKPETVAATLIQLKPSAAAQTAVQALKEFCGSIGVPSPLPGEMRRLLYNQDLAGELERRFDSSPPDFIYERASLYGIAGATLARALGVPLLLELNAPLSVEQSAYRGGGLGELAAAAERWTLAQADAVLTVSAPLRDHVLSLGIAPERVHVIPNGVDPLLFQPAPADSELRARIGLGSQPVIGFVGGLRPWHGVEVLPELLQRLPAAQLLVVGDGQLRPSLERDFQARGLGERVVFSGAVSHAESAALMRLFDVALAPYPQLDHTFYFSPLKLFEYMACGVPVVAAAVGQVAEVVRDGETGFLYRPGDIDALAAACHRLLNNPALRSTLGQAASQLVRTQYTWDHNAARVVELAQALAQARKNA